MIDTVALLIGKLKVFHVNLAINIIITPVFETGNHFFRKAVFHS